MASESSKALKLKAIKGTIWTIISYGTGQILRFGSNLILTRLLFPDLFGLMGLTQVFLTGLNLFSDLGINASVIQNERGDDPKFLNTAWTLQIIRGAILWLCCWIIAYPAAQFYSQPQLLWLIPLVGLNTLIAGFDSTALATLNRHLDVKALTLCELGGQAISISVMLTWAYFHPSIWALIAGGLVSTVFKLILSHYLNKKIFDGKFRNRLEWDPSAFKSLITFGKWIFLSTLIFFLSSQADRLILGRFFTIELLGIYSIAFALADIPGQVIFAIATQVLYPVYSKMADLPRAEFRAKIIRNRWPLIVMAAMGIALLAGLGDLIIEFLYDERYTPATWMFSTLILGVWPMALIYSVDRGLWALGKPGYWTVGSFFSFLCLIIGIPLGFHSPLGEVGGVLAVAVSNVPIWFVVTYGLWREKLLAIHQDFLATLLLFTALALIIWVRIQLGFSSPFDTLPFLH